VLTVVPDEYSPVHSSTVPSPFQSQPYLTVSSSGSVVLVEYVYETPVLPDDGPDGVLGVFGALLAPEITTVFADEKPLSAPYTSLALTLK